MPRIGTLLLLTLFASLAVATPPSHGHRRRKPSSVQSLKGRLGGIQDRKRDLRAQIHQTRAQAQAVKQVIGVVDDRLQTVRGQIETTQRDLGAARLQQRTATTRLAQATADLMTARERARARLRAIGKGSDANLLAAFVTSRSVGDLSDRKDTMERIARRDHEIFTRVKLLQRMVTERKRAQDAAVSRVAALESRERAQQESLRVVRAEKGQQLQGLRKKEADQQEALQQFEDDEREIRRLIEIANRAMAVRRPGHSSAPAFIGRFMRPVNAPITSGFGMRYHPILHITRLHAGVDFGAAIGTPVRSAAPGEVVAATCMRGFGNVVIVDHGGGVQTVYGHLSRIGVSAGQHLAQGQVLGAVGMTGLATGPHLHWEVHVGGRPVNPLGRL